MKRILFILMLGALLTGCEEKKTKTLENKVNEDGVNLGIDTNKPEPQSFVIIKKTSGIPDTTITTLKNQNAIALDLPDYYYVDLLSIATTEEGISDWLKENDKFIDFPLSAPFIEVSHNLRDKKDLDIIDDIHEDKYVKIKWSDLKTKMEGLSMPTNNHYDTYLNFGDANSTLYNLDNITSTEFDYNKVIYSVALFNSIIYNHDLKNKDVEIAFTNAKLRGMETIIFRVTDVTDINNKIIISYCDFTHRPPTKLIPKTTYSFL
ncbi:hypothetical protein ACX0HA_02470 [Flavobacterium hauense]